MRVNRGNYRIRIATVWNKLQYSADNLSIRGFIISKEAIAEVKVSITEKFIHITVYYNGFAHFSFQKIKGNVSMPGVVKIVTKVIKQTIIKEKDNQKKLKFKG